MARKSPAKKTPTKKTPTKKKPSEANDKAKHGTILRELKQEAKLINAGLDKAGVADVRAIDLRLTVATQLAAVEKKCKLAKISFKKWVEDNIEQSFETVRKLTSVGHAEVPAEALADMREKNATANRKLRAKNKAPTHSANRGEGQGNTGPTQTTATPTSRVIDALDAMGDEAATKLLKGLAGDYGLTAYTKTTGIAPLAIAKSAFDVLGGGDKMKLAKYAAEKTGGTFKTGFEDAIKKGGKKKKKPQTSEELLASANETMARVSKKAASRRDRQLQGAL